MILEMVAVFKPVLDCHAVHRFLENTFATLEIALNTLKLGKFSVSIFILSHMSNANEQEYFIYWGKKADL